MWNAAVPLIALSLLMADCAPGPGAPLSLSRAPTATIVAPEPSRESSAVPSASPTGPPSTRLNGPIQRLDAQVGFATTETGLIRTQDGGGTWAALARMDGAFFSELRFVDAFHGWAIAERWAPSTICVSPKTAPPCWTVMTTSDGGTSWTDRLSLPGNQLGTAVVTSLQAIDDQRAWVVVQTTACPITACVGELRMTQDGGQTWTVQLSREGGLGPVRFASAARGWIAAARPGDARRGVDILTSADGGVSWSTVFRSADDVLTIDAASEREAWILTRDGAFCTSSSCSRYDLLRTSDAGTTWTSLGNPYVQATCSGGHLRGLVFASPSAGWMGISLGPGGANVGDGGLMRSRDGGRTWDCRRPPQNVSFVSVADPLRVWARSDPGGSSLKGSVPALLASEDGGDTWHALTIAFR